MDPHRGFAIRELADRTRSRGHTHTDQVTFETTSGQPGREKISSEC